MATVIRMSKLDERIRQLREFITTSRELDEICDKMEKAHILPDDGLLDDDTNTKEQLPLCSRALPLISEACSIVDRFIVATKPRRKVNEKAEQFSTLQVFDGVKSMLSPRSWQSSECLALLNAFRIGDYMPDKFYAKFSVSETCKIELSCLNIYHLALRVTAMKAGLIASVSSSSDEDGDSGEREDTPGEKFDYKRVRIIWLTVNKMLATYYKTEETMRMRPTANETETVIGTEPTAESQGEISDDCLETKASRRTRPIAKIMPFQINPVTKEDVPAIRRNLVATHGVPPQITVPSTCNLLENVVLTTPSEGPTERPLISYRQLEGKTTTAPAMKRLFISYSWSYYAKHVRQVAQFLKTKNYDVWLDIEQMYDSVIERSVEGIKSADVVLAFLCRNYAKEGSNSRNQLTLAHRNKKKIVFVLLQNIYQSANYDYIKYVMGNRTWVDNNMIADSEQLCRQIEQTINSGNLPSPVEQRSPALMLGDQTMLEGYVHRPTLERMISMRTMQLCRKEILLVYGVGGIGKTMLLRSVLNSLFLGNCGFAVRVWLNVYQISKSFTDESFFKAIASVFELKVDESNLYSSAVRQHVRSFTDGYVLFIFDDVFNQKVFDCAKTLGKNVRIICVSRENFSAKLGVISEPVCPMTSDDIKAMFRKCERNIESSVLEKLAILCNGLPLVAQVISSNVKRNPDAAKRYINQFEKYFPRLANETGYVDDDKKAEVISELLLISFEHQKPEFRRRYYAFLMFDEGSHLDREDLAILWLCNDDDEVSQFCEALVDMSLVRSDLENRQFNIHAYLYDAALEFVKKDASNADLAAGLQSFKSNRNVALAYLRKNYLASFRHEGTNENVLHFAIKRRREKILQTLISMMNADRQDDLLFILCGQQSASSFGGQLPLHLLVKGNWIKNEGSPAEWNVGLDFACFLADRLLLKNQERGVHLLQVKNDVGESVADLLLNNTNNDKVPWHNNALLLCGGRGYRALQVFLLNQGCRTDITDNYGNSLALIASQNGQLTIIWNLLQRFKDFDVNAGNLDGQTALMIAATHGDTLSYEKLLESTKLAVDWQDDDGNTALILAAKNCEVDFAMQLLQAGANPEIRNSNGDSPIWFAQLQNSEELVKLLQSRGAKLSNDEEVLLALRSYAIHRSKKTENIDECEKPKFDRVSEGIYKLLDLKKPNPDEKQFYDTFVQCIYDDEVEKAENEAKRLQPIPEKIISEALVMAAFLGNVNASAYLANKATVNVKVGTHKKTPLHYVSQNGHVEVVNILIRVEAQVNARDKDDWTPLHFASEKGHADVMFTLINYGAQVDVRDKDEWTPLHFASEKGHADVVKILIGKKAQVDVRDKDKWTPLHFASENGHAKVVKFLIRSGAEINAKDKDGWTPLHIASQNGHADVVQILIRKMAQVDAREKNEWTPLHIASKNGHAEVVQILVENKANPTLRTKLDSLAIDIARKNDRLEVVAILNCASRSFQKGNSN